MLSSIKNKRRSSKPATAASSEFHQLSPSEAATWNQGRRRRHLSMDDDLGMNSAPLTRSTTQSGNEVRIQFRLIKCALLDISLSFRNLTTLTSTVQLTA